MADLTREQVRLAIHAAASSDEWNALADGRAPALLEFCRKFGDAVLAAHGAMADPEAEPSDYWYRRYHATLAVLRTLQTAHGVQACPESDEARRERLITNGYKTDSRCTWLAAGKCAECGRVHDGKPLGVPELGHQVSPPSDADAHIPAEVGRRVLKALWAVPGPQVRDAITELQQALEKKNA